MMPWKEILNIHITLAKFPEKEKFLKSLYPDAFIENDISDLVTIKLVKEKYHPGKFLITYGEKKVAKLILQRGSGYTEQGQRLRHTFQIEVKPGFLVKIQSGGGTDVIKYGHMNSPGGGKK